MALLNGDQSKSFLFQLVKIFSNSPKAIGYQKLTVDSTAGGVALTVPAGTTYAKLSFESSVASTTVSARYKELGPVYPPTATDGIQMRDGLIFDVSEYQNLINFRAIQTGGGTHQLHVQYYK